MLSRITRSRAPGLLPRRSPAGPVHARAPAARDAPTAAGSPHARAQVQPEIPATISCRSLRRKKANSRPSSCPTRSRLSSYSRSSRNCCSSGDGTHFVMAGAALMFGIVDPEPRPGSPRTGTRGAQSLGLRRVRVRPGHEAVVRDVQRVDSASTHRCPPRAVSAARPSSPRAAARGPDRTAPRPPRPSLRPSALGTRKWR